MTDGSVRVAAIDCGTNSIRLLVLDAALEDGRAVGRAALHRENRIVRLGQGVDATGRIAPEAMERTDVVGLANRHVSALSGGQRQRVWVAMALAQRTDILLLDEPTTYLDLAHQVDLLELCRDLNTELGTTIVAVLHDLNQACRYGDEVIAMRAGSILAHGRPEEVVTAEMVEEVFGLKVQVISDPLTGTPLVLPLPRRTRDTASGGKAG